MRCLWVALIGPLCLIPWKASQGDAIQALKATSSPLENPSGSRFRRIPKETSGLNLTHHFPDEAPLRLFQDFGASAGICTGDIDQDGLPDVFVGNYNQGARLYRNLGGLRFEDITHSSGISTGQKWCTGAGFADLDNDGDLDLHVCAYRSENMVFLNDGKGHFQETAQSLGLNFNGASIMMSFADYDQDGFLDGYLVTHRYVDIVDSKLPSNTRETMDRNLLKRGKSGYEIAPAYEELFGIVDKGGGRMELMITGQADHLFQNDQDQRFTDVSHSAGIAGNDIGLAAIWWDYNDDGAPDIYVSNDYKGADKLYENQKDGTFKNVHLRALPYVPWSSMGSAIADINNDGLVDLIASDMAGTSHARRNLINDDLNRERWFYLATLPKQVRRNTVFLGTGSERVLEAAAFAGLSQSDWTWSPKFGDFDLDGDVDLFITNGMARDFLHGDLLEVMREKGNAQWIQYPIHKERDLLFENKGDLRFRLGSSPWGIDSLEASFGASVCDLDRDGDLDILITHLEAPVTLLENTSGEGERLLIELEGVESNRKGIGSKITLTTSHGMQTRYLGANSGFMSADEPVAHFAVPEGVDQASLEILWPNGRLQTTRLTQWNAHHLIQEVLDLSPVVSRESGKTEPLYAAIKLPPDLMHRENPYDDFAVQPLLPARLSNLGPPLAVADVNRDGLEDFYLGAAIGTPGKLMIQSEGGSFTAGTIQHLKQDVMMEDSDALFIDVDSDGNEDLLVLSGGVAYPEGSKGYSDRYYQNDGTGQLRSIPDFALGTTPQSGGVITSADVDHDGDLDLFVGRRTVPRQFGQSPISGVFLNQDGQFVEDPHWSKDHEGRIGMVHGAVWTDVNQDGWMDLMVATDWGPIRLWQNQGGSWKETTVEAGLEELRGRWRGLSAGDVDGDGDMDILATNIGRNDDTNGNRALPHGLLTGSLEGVPHPILIELYEQDGRVYPLRTRNALFNGVPGLAERYPSYESFARVDKDALIQALPIKNRQILRVHTLDTGLLINDGEGHFLFRPLPPLAQLAPSFGALIQDVDGDGWQDVVLGQNATTRSPELGPSAAGMAMLLRGRGDGSFEPMPPTHSGLNAFQETRSLARIEVGDGPAQGLLFGINRRAPQAYQPKAQGHWLSITLKGKAGNVRSAGSRVIVELANGQRQTFETHAKSGFATQSSHRIVVGLGTSPPHSVHAKVRWPTGEESSHTLDTIRTFSHTLNHPE